MKSSGYVNGVTGVERSRRFGGELTLGLDETQSRLVKVLFNPAVDLNARQAALNTLEASHRSNPAVDTVLREHCEPLKETLREPEVIPPQSPR